MERTTSKDLDIMINRINRKLGFENAKYNTVGAFVIDHAYGGYRVCRITNTGGGQRDMSDRGTAKETYNWLCGYESSLQEI